MEYYYDVVKGTTLRNFFDLNQVLQDLRQHIFSDLLKLFIFLIYILSLTMLAFKETYSLIKLRNVLYTFILFIIWFDYFLEKIYYF